VNVGYIDAIGLSLSSVSVAGDLGRIDAGGGATATALGTLSVHTLGAMSGTQGGLTYSTESNITGTLGTLNVLGNLDGAVNAQDYKSRPGTGNIGHLNIGGSIDGSNSSGAGVVLFTGTLGTAVIDGGIEGGSSELFGSISGAYGTYSKIGSITVKGSVPDDPNPSPIPSVPGTSILGGSGQLSGGISAAKIGKVSIAGDVYGGTGVASGDIQAGDTLGTVTIAGSLIGGNFAAGSPTEANSSGVVFGATVGSVTIGKNIIGGSGLSSGQVYSTGTIQKVIVMGDLDGGSAGTSSSSGLSGVIQGTKIGSVLIDGSVNGGNLVSGDSNQLATYSGGIFSNTSIGSVTILGNLNGGTGQSGGNISTDGGGLGTLVIGTKGGMTGSVIGGSGAAAGSINIDGVLGKATLYGNLTGASGSSSGTIEVNGAANSLEIAGNVTGGTADNTGTISIFGLLKSTTIGGSIIGSSSGSTLLTNTGYIQADGIGTMTVTGTLTSGTAGSGGIDTSGAIRSTVAIGSITVGSLVGNATNPAIISAVGKANLASNATSDLTIGTLTVKGAVAYADILAGYSTDTQNGSKPLGTGVNADAQIGTVIIEGNFTATNIVAGVGPGSTGFGTSGSSQLSGPGVSDMTSIISKISKVIIDGSVTPTSGTTDSYGIAAQYVVSASVDGAPVTLIAGPDNNTFAAHADQQLPTGTGDVFLYEV
jgi:hypothetical protein